MMQRETFRLGMSDVDAFGIVYYAKFWEWFGLGVEGLLESVGHTLRELLEAGIGFPVVHAEIDYRSPIRLGDRVDMTVCLQEIGRRSMHFTAQFRHDGELVASATTVQVPLYRDGRPAPVPAWLREALNGDY